MSRKFTIIPQNTFREMQLNAGVLLKTFDPTGATPVEDADIICATTGGINATCIPTYRDNFEDVDNAPNNTKEGMEIDGWDCKLAFTSLNVSAEYIRMSLGAADISGSKVTPRSVLQSDDFKDVWWVGDRGDGGYVAVHLLNALSTGGFSLQTTKNGKGQVSTELTGHVSIDNLDKVPMEFYSEEGEAA